MKIAIVGAGGVGGYFGARWAQHGLDVHFMARGDHLRAIVERGLAVRSPLGGVRVVRPASSEPSEIGVSDVVVVATKTWQLEDAARSLAPLVGPDTLVFGLQNGVEAAEVLARRVGAGHVLGGTCRIIAYVRAPGEIEHAGMEPSMHVGVARGGSLRDSWRGRLEALSGAPGMSLIQSDDIDVDVWRKFVFFAPVSAIGSVTQATIGAFRSLPPVRKVLHAAMAEVAALAKARGVALAADTLERVQGFIDQLPAEGTSSMQRDFRDGRRTELEALCGAVVRLGAESGVPVPVHEVLYAALLPAELRARERHAAPISSLGGNEPPS